MLQSSSPEGTSGESALKKRAQQQNKPSASICVVLGGMKRDSVSNCSQEPVQFSSLGSLLHVRNALVEPPTPTAGHVRPRGSNQAPILPFLRS